MHQPRFHDRSDSGELLDDLIHTLGRAEILNVLRILAEEPATCREISVRMELDDSSVSGKLGMLRRLGLVQFKQRKKNRIYAVSPEVRVKCRENTFELSITLENGEQLSMESHYYRASGVQSDGDSKSSDTPEFSRSVG